jgi:hypothetical protein
LATVGRRPVWTSKHTGGAVHFRSALPIPRIDAQGALSDIFCAERFIEALPLVHFLRGICGSLDYRGPGLRANFIVDDPNLHWPSYGFVRFRALAERARDENFHVCFATVPLDGWLVHPGAAATLKENIGHLSLAIHGNNHAKREFAAVVSPAQSHALLAQAIVRIQNLERKSGLRVCRSMIPPHGACSAQTLSALPATGFESACISAGSLRAYNRDKAWSRALGVLPAEMVERCPVLPRSGLTGDVENGLLLAAYLDRPMILRAHHSDFRGGIDRLDAFAGYVNGLGDVRWGNMTDLSRMSWVGRMVGDEYRVRLYTNRALVQIPGDATHIVIEEILDADRESLRLVSASSHTRAGATWHVSEETTAPVGSRTLSVARACDRTVGTAADGGPRTGGLLVARRLLAEARDRLCLL